MPSLKAIRKRIASVKNTQKITKAMKMVAAARLRRAQEAVQALRPYARHLGQIAHDLASHLADEPEPEAAVEAAAEEQPSDSPAVKEEAAAGQAVVPTPAQLRRILIGRGEKRVRLVVVSADRGLAGAYNSNIFRRTERQITELKLEGREVDLLVLGKKGRDFFRRRPHKIVRELAGVDPKSMLARSQELAQLLTRSLFADECDSIYVVFNEFKHAASISVKVQRLLPVEITGGKNEAASDEPKTLVDFLYEPDRDAVLAHLLPLYLQTELQRMFLEAIASELGARMSAMDSASRNAKEMISRLTLQYNRARQALITKELMEIIGGAEALKG
jgi:F-type H+-transporting ATPase subunit gamma